MAAGKNPGAPLVLGERSLTPEEVEEVAVGGRPVALSEAALQRVAAARRAVEAVAASGQAVYGITTGFGHLASVRISADQIRELQRNLVRSHATGLGPPLSTEVVRAMMLLRANSLAKGYSGIRPESLARLVEGLNRRIHPVIPSKGSVGASGDLIPLAHLAQALIGEGVVEWEGRRLPAAEAWRQAGLPPLKLEAKEGLALINGTELMSASAALTLARIARLSCAADVAGALTLQVLAGTAEAFDPRLHRVRPHPGQVATAANLRRLLAGSRLLRRRGEGLPQDAYSLRAMPQVHGAAKDAFRFAREVLAIELNSAVDNPLIFGETAGSILSGANFHGQPVAQALDFVAIGIAHLSKISERRCERLVNPYLNGGLPAFLAGNSGLHSGMMLAQYAAAALAAENRLLAVPASVDSIPTSAGQEDVVSMGAASAAKALESTRNLAGILALELACVAQAADLRGVEGLSPATRRAYEAVRRRVAPVKEDRSLSEEVQSLAEALLGPEFMQEVDPPPGETRNRRAGSGLLEPFGRASRRPSRLVKRPAPPPARP